MIAGPAGKSTALVSNSKLKIFASVGLDKYLRLYSTDKFPNKRSLINTIELSSVGKSCDFSPDGKHLVIGSDNGLFEVFNVYENDGSYF